MAALEPYSRTKRAPNPQNDTSEDRVNDNWLKKVHFGDLFKGFSCGFFFELDRKISQKHGLAVKYSFKMVAQSLFQNEFIQEFRIAGTLEAEMFTCYR